MNKTEELLESSAEQLKLMDDTKLAEFFKDVLHVTRPELAVRPRQMNKPIAVIAKPEFKNKVAEMAKAGLDMSWLQDLKNKKGKKR
jgi:hypothetical protein